MNSISTYESNNHKFFILKFSFKNINKILFQLIQIKGFYFSTNYLWKFLNSTKMGILKLLHTARKNEEKPRIGNILELINGF